ncbi:uncharacterized protein BO95DRAFT_287171 [Aspergillus brunneoviolaceus CBS 621.78]|uniref:Uncharacterized protein n=1 Tax=Aspergillus brunneoviolaceus CBS 621.78 TaxID=1450534 RepID=A0ACD1GK37_9EURO|nr:hypothetical protein BO95DRAFT_287171 [Aspergillus brunneoviolaceus CBS 621.78]RAH49503.1 hypothetical protein BO95DRAFT_287171 [Aspergillus brunneoviolaceus CBS 621.78]
MKTGIIVQVSKEENGKTKAQRRERKRKRKNKNKTKTKTKKESGGRKRGCGKKKRERKKQKLYQLVHVLLRPYSYLIRHTGRMTLPVLQLPSRRRHRESAGLRD